METWYLVSIHYDRIREVEALRSTDKCIFIKSAWKKAGESKELKTNRTSFWHFSSMEAASAKLIEVWQSRVRSAKEELVRAERILDEREKTLELVTQRYGAQNVS